MRDDPGIAEQSTTRLLLVCPDRPGLIARVSGFLADAGLNIVDADQHSSHEGRFFMRMAFEPAPEGERAALYERFAEQLQLARLGGVAVLGVDGHVVEGEAERFHLLGVVGVVGDDAGQVSAELAAAPAPEQVREAVVFARDHDRHLLALAR
ncbi:MAG TPA: ACT domain-containing protein, partial [Solirubrobacterales bacterium]|nr:ACT domain-containing protein [Solirubrobacterales bacterium]